jgi:hypothetical protein
MDHGGAVREDASSPAFREISVGPGLLKLQVTQLKPTALIRVQTLCAGMMARSQLSLVLIDHTWLGRNGGLAPTSMPLFQGLRGAGLSATGD